MKVYVVSAFDHELHEIVGIYTDKKIALKLASEINKIYLLKSKLNEIEREEMHKYWESHQHIADKSRTLDDYHKEQSYIHHVELKIKLYDILHELKAPSYGVGCDVKDWKLNE
jgi:hypothetical protein